MRNAIAFGVGLVFALGLGLGGMTQPARIVGFLDVAGAWDPTLVFVMAGAVGSHMLTWRWIRRQRHPVLANRFQIPQGRQIDPRLLLGAAIFGVGWGITGFCPGPAVTALASGNLVPIVMVGAMLAGMLLFDLSPLGRPRGTRARVENAAPLEAGPTLTAPTDA